MSVGSDLTSTRELPEQQQQQNNKDPSRTPTSNHEPATSQESGVLGQRTRKSVAANESMCTPDKRTRKTSMVRKKFHLPSVNQNDQIHESHACEGANLAAGQAPEVCGSVRRHRTTRSLNAITGLLLRVQAGAVLLPEHLVAALPLLHPAPAIESVEMRRCDDGDGNAEAAPLGGERLGSHELQLDGPQAVTGFGWEMKGTANPRPTVVAASPEGRPTMPPRRPSPRRCWRWSIG
ncbi:hypothetical protein ZWY2020_058445 [Hordeum vulgare]|nr:hypothetical protein ZWY2020_058445 [Hordeum vulgare]